MVPKYKGVTWTRRDLEQGRFQLDVEQDQLNDEDAIACDNILEVVRDGAHEFAGVFEKREWQSADRSWVITGGDLKSFHLSHREIDPGRVGVRRADRRGCGDRDDSLRHRPPNGSERQCTEARQRAHEPCGGDLSSDGERRRQRRLQRQMGQPLRLAGGYRGKAATCGTT